MESKYEDECVEGKVDESKIESPAGIGKSTTLNSLLKERNNGEILSSLHPFYQSKIQYGLEDFYTRYAGEFDPEESENKLVYWEIYGRFEELFDGYLEEFVKTHHLDPGEFRARLEAARESRGGRSSTLLKLIIAQTDYEFFVSLMKDKAKSMTPSSHHK